jgi:hypothetical protein
MRIRFTKLRGAITAVAVITALFGVGSAASASATTTPAVSTTHAAQPAIKWKNCSGEYGKTTSVVIALYVYYNPGLKDYCYSGKGTWKFPGVSAPYIVENFCAGNNEGTFTYLQKDKVHSFKFGPGKDVNFRHSPVTFAKTLVITGWKGSDKCGT